MVSEALQRGDGAKMPAYLVSVVFLMCFVQLCAPVRANPEVVPRRFVVPHDVYPGFAIARLGAGDVAYRLLESELSPFFALVENGLLITVGNISHLADSDASLVLLEDRPEGGTVQRPLRIRVLDGATRLRFDAPSYAGRVLEHSPVGTVVDGLEFVTASRTPGVVDYSIVAGNEDDLFRVEDAVVNATRGVRLAVAADRLDREIRDAYTLQVRAADSRGVDAAAAVFRVTVLDLNDHAPMFDREDYYVRIMMDTPRFTPIAQVKAYDADGDRVLYRMTSRSSAFFVVPKTGEVFLIGEPQPKSYHLEVTARDDRTPSRTAAKPAQLHVEVSTGIVPAAPQPTIYESNHLNLDGLLEPEPLVGRPPASVTTERGLEPHARQKRHVKRSVRPTKTVEHRETDGSKEGQVVFTLENETGREKFQLRDDNPWVVVDTNGAVRVRKKWDYEELGPEKSIDFWVTITNTRHGEIDNQRVIIRIRDVNDELPHFINRPLPMRAVVKLNAPLGTPVYKLQARDQDTDANIHYFLVRDFTGGRFEVDERSGEVRTRTTELFELDREYILYVKAEDQNGRISDREFQSTKEERLSIVGGQRPPQFYMQSYEATIPENKKKDSDILAVKAKSFAQREIRYTLKAHGMGAGTFNIGASNGIVKLAKELDYEDPRQPHTYSLLVTATEDSGGFSTSVELTIHVTDVNDNPPKFELPDYQAHNIDEDVIRGTSILKVKATDADHGQNAEIEYSVSDNNFTINQHGEIFSNRRLDADDNGAFYMFTVTAKDKGEPPKTGTATVRVYTKNKNDEAPKFSQDVYTPNVDENAGPNTLVTTVVASDKDGDNVKFGFAGGSNVSGQFTIEEMTGVIRLNQGPITLDKDKYELNVTARDDGSCCERGTSSIHTSTALVVVFITDVNDKKPIFDDCSSYNPKVQEGAPSGSSVLKVTATDEDKGQNGQVRYSIVQQPNQKGTKFVVDEITGEIKTNKVFDREGEDGKFVSVTVKATDMGAPQLEGVCSFKVEITDINDNPPLFDRQEYREKVKQDTSIGTNILRVSASDEDADNNGAIVYNLTSPYNPTDLDYFKINLDSGWITLMKTLDRDMYQLQAIAQDKGHHPLYKTVDVIIEVVDRANNPPVWDQTSYGPFTVKENTTVGTRILSVKARSGIDDNPTVYYSLIKGSTAQTNKYDSFYVQPRSENGFTWADIFVNQQLDYESIKEYNLTIRVENNGAQQLASEATIHIIVVDVNDEIPLFTENEMGSVLEGEKVGTRVTHIHAIDKDGNYPYNQVYYTILDTASNEGSKYFDINRSTGEIFTKVVFDREEKQAYAIQVRAEDGAPSARPSAKHNLPNYVTKFIRIGIADKNDNPPYFDKSLYEAEVDENEDIQHTVITVTANDRDESSRIRYEITRGNIGGAFAVKNETGAIYVAGPLDYEARKRYELRLVASDNLNENYTTVIIHVKDVNDNPPVFDRPTYQTQITEEDDRSLPKKILQVTATDGDKDRKQDIVYFLTGQGVDDTDSTNSRFAINTTSGDIYVLKPLDRDQPEGRPEWRFTVFAQDEGGDGLVGYADVKVTLQDINDNFPFFPQGLYVGNVTENGTIGMVVMTMTATDYDDPNEGTNARLKYSIEKNVVNEMGKPIFEIEEDTGVIKTAVCCLDRERTPEYSIQVVATDGGDKKGPSGTGTATIKVKDINDMPPSFTKEEWYAEVPETEGDNIPEQPILVVSVKDDDLPETNNFHYKVIESSGFGADKFTMVRNADGTGSLKVAKPLDYEDPRQRYGFNFTIQVNDKGGDSDDKYHIAFAKVRIKLLDINDNKPEFEKSNIEVTYPEDSATDTSLAKFLATDADQGGKSRVSYAIDRSSDRKRQFAIQPDGTVKIQRMLDREETPRHQVKILAIDDGVPAKTSTATLTIIVKDINDNAPRFLMDYRPVIPENTPMRRVVEILAMDDDDRSRGNGPPFHFYVDPQAPDYIRQFFKVDHDPKGANGDGMAIVHSTLSFDREVHKEYLVPIVIKDDGNPPMSGTSTLTITIGDANDNRMQPGSTDIFVYNLNGESPDTEIGRVYVQDLDDWDIADKTFFWEGNRVHPNFTLDRETGIITMLHGTKAGKYQLYFTVYDRQHTQEVKANVTVTVQNIPLEAVHNSGSVRISGITDEDFIRIWDYQEQKVEKSRYEKFREKIAELVGTSKENVDIFTVMLKQERPPITDVRFSAHGSPYFKATRLNGLVAQHRESIEASVGINITMVGIDECIFENFYCEDSCTNELTVSSVPYMVNSNKTSLVSVRAEVIPECVCAARDFSKWESCRKVECFNGGRCVESGIGVTCECPRGFDGPRCQLTSRSFRGNGWAWLPPLQQCDSSHLSLEILTLEPHGLIFYNGPMVDPEPEEVLIQDFISLELINGRPRLLIDFGSGTLELKIENGMSLADGEWHRIDIFWETEQVRMVVDFCKYADIDDREATGGPPKFERSKCEAKGGTPPFNEYLNLNSPLQIGGVSHGRLNYPWGVDHGRAGFSGCIRNLIHNSVMYDLASPGLSRFSKPGCVQTESLCRTHDVEPFCLHGTCVGSLSHPRCECKPGYYGAHCDKVTKPSTFDSESFVKYALSFEPDVFSSDIQLRFRTRREHGELFRISNQHDREYSILEIQDKYLRYRYNLNNARTDEHELWLSAVKINDGQWHTVRVSRYGSVAMISLDGGEGKRYNETLEYEGKHQQMKVEKQNVFAGGYVEYSGPGLATVHNDFHTGCMDDVRYDQKHLPLPPRENGTEVAAVVDAKHVRNGCPSNNPCLGFTCRAPFICADLWMLAECRCANGMRFSDDDMDCVPSTTTCQGLHQYCHNGGTCISTSEYDDEFFCLCPPEFKGIHCEVVISKVPSLIKSGLGTIVAIAAGAGILISKTFSSY